MLIVAMNSRNTGRSSSEVAALFQVFTANYNNAGSLQVMPSLHCLTVGKTWSMANILEGTLRGVV